MNLLLCVIEESSGLKINFHKSDFFCYGETKRRKHEYTEFFGCDTGSYLFVYLGIPL